MKRIAIVLALAGLFAPATARAQSPEAEVRQVIESLFGGMRTGDSTAVRAAFLPGADLHSAAVRRDGSTVLREDTVDAFVRAVGEPHEQPWDERIDAIDIRVDGPLAVVTVDYSFYLGTTFSHCGIDAFQLYRTPEGWKIFQLTDTRRRTGCPATPGSNP